MRQAGGLPEIKKKVTGCRFCSPAFDLYMEAIKMKIVVVATILWIFLAWKFRAYFAAGYSQCCIDERLSA
jgi:hypothetical protein